MSPDQSRWAWRESDDEQPPHAAIVHPPGVAARLGEVRHQDEARPEEHGEDRHELLVGEHPAHHPDVEVRAFEVPVGRGVEVRRPWHCELLDVHHQDAEHREAAKDVERVDAPGLGDGSRIRMGDGAGHGVGRHAWGRMEESVPSESDARRRSSGARPARRFPTCMRRAAPVSRLPPRAP